MRTSPRIRVLRSSRRFGLELLAVVLGVTISFWLEDQRKDRADRAEEQRLLESFATELRGDLATLENYGKRLADDTARMQGALADDGKLDDKALDALMDTLLGYAAFRPATATYSELRQTGASRVFRDKALLRRVLNVYERLYPMAGEWDAVNREFVLGRAFPYVDEAGPAFASSGEQGYAHGYHLAWRALRNSPHFRNLLRSSVVFRQGQAEAYRLVAGALKTLVAELPSGK
ncbi:MAG: hypothetical protein JNK49_02620 [Planctomycetes bacterium]|nr:hypothetical protein [Planctomycetota bacterium]